LADPVNGMLLVTCVDIINMMTVKHGTPQAPDSSHLKHQLSLPLKHLSDYTAHLSNFKENLADLDFFQLPIPAYDQFTMFLQTMPNHPAVTSRMTMYFSTNPNGEPGGQPRVYVTTAISLTEFMFMNMKKGQWVAGVVGKGRFSLVDFLPKI
jgi:hypothetical protein